MKRSTLIILAIAMTGILIGSAVAIALFNNQQQSASNQIQSTQRDNDSELASLDPDADFEEFTDAELN